eukprot:TRINITY_DN7013_c0_g1_i1.p1 TRINITY_DN7013_c0_g1~~TRINITY_DN7013_c0_g1_i1.p1  ORF type:complete len:551 (-),score=81.21 TRINITY_DN7013_c0_g1_i1:413-1834(-)
MIGLSDLVGDFVNGIDVCMLAYGQTGSGKTHTMLGPPGVLTDRAIEGGGVPSEWGCWPRAILSALAHDGVELHLWAVEIYFDNVFDLLDGKKVVKTGGKVNARGISSYGQTNQAQYEGGKWVPPLAAGADGEFRTSSAAAKMNESAVSGQSKVKVESAADVVRVGRMVEMTRVAQSHALNDRSSRSHAVLGADLLRRVDGKVVRSTLLVCDLAGSERIKKTGSDGLVQDEARAINSSLSALQRVVAALSQKAKFVPYRDSALTTLLRPALSGSSRMHAVVTVASDPAWADETRNSLRFAKEIGRVENIRKSGLQSASRSVEDEQSSLLAELGAIRAQLNGLPLGGLRTDVTQALRDQFYHNLQQFEHFHSQLNARKQAKLEGHSDAGDEKYCQEKVDLHRAALERMQSRDERHGPGIFDCPPASALAKYDRVVELEDALMSLHAPVERIVLPDSIALALRLRRILHPSLLNLK